MSNQYTPNDIITVFIEHNNNEINQVGYELIGKARELAAKNNMKVFAVLALGARNENDELDLELLEHLVDHIDIYKYNDCLNLNVLDYCDCLKSNIYENKPIIVLVGATPIGRSFAPRVAAHFKTGITADCTGLEFSEEKEFIQIRPAYGGDVYARIVTPKSFPQMATVRPKIMEMPQYRNNNKASIKVYGYRKSNNEISILKKERLEEVGEKIEDAKIIALAGNAIKYKYDLDIIKKLAKLLHGEWAATRPLVEGGLASYDRQVGISGKTIRPDLVIACGVSGTSQTLSGIEKAKKIVAVNIDKNAPIFKNADIGIISDWKQVVEELINKISYKDAAAFKKSIYLDSI
jgi:electron transfer flavoprotein alpha subunit